MILSQAIFKNFFFNIFTIAVDKKELMEFLEYINFKLISFQSRFRTFHNILDFI